MLDANDKARIEAALAANNWSVTKAAEALEVPRTTLSSALRRLGIRRDAAKASNITFPPFVTEGDDDEPVSDLIDRLTRAYQRKEAAAQSRDWFTIDLAETKPYGVVFFGDPHVGDPGCNWPLLRKHVEICHCPGIYGVSIGDVTNRWVGKLVRKYAEQETTRTQEERLGQWFLGESGVTWLTWVLGNHDMWDGGTATFSRMFPGVVPMLEWKAQFYIRTPNENKVAIDLSHGRKGKSIWNELHSTLRDAKMGAPAHIFGTGHTHNFAMEKLEIPDRKAVSWLLQLAGYKRMDSYARDNGFSDYKHGSSIMAIIDPENASCPVLQCFDDIERGADYLEWLRRD